MTCILERRIFYEERRNFVHMQYDIVNIEKDFPMFVNKVNFYFTNNINLKYFSNEMSTSR